MAFMAIEDIRVDRWFAGRLPKPEKEELAALAADIKERGVLVDLLVTTDGLLLDGHRRLEAAKLAGLSRVPVKKIQVDDGKSWRKAVAIAVNLYRRHLSEAQRADLGSSLLRIERVKAKERQLEGQRRGGKRAGEKGKGGEEEMVSGNGAGEAKDPDRATQRVADAVGVSRKTFERVEAVKKADPETAKGMLNGDMSVAAAYRKVKGTEARKAAEQEAAENEGNGAIKDLAAVMGKYRTVYVDLRRGLWDGKGGESEAMGGLREEELKALCLSGLSHASGCHFWIRTSWALMRRCVVQRLLDGWGVRWVGEFLWDRGRSGGGEWIHPSGEVVIVAQAGKLPPVSVVKPRRGREKGRGGSEKSLFMLMEAVSLPPRIELFSNARHDGWDAWLGAYLRGTSGGSGRVRGNVRQVLDEFSGREPSHA